MDTNEDKPLLGKPVEHEHRHIHSHIHVIVPSKAGEKRQVIQHTHWHVHTHTHPVTSPDHWEKQQPIEHVHEVFEISPWYSDRATRLVVGRLGLRLLALLALFIAYKLLRPFHWIVVKEYLDYTMDFIQSFPIYLAVVIYTCAATVFCTFSPSGYAPSVVAGITFGPIVGPIISYFVVNAGALFNMIWVRLARTMLLKVKKIRTIFDEQSFRVHYLEVLLKYMPLKTVILMRLPFLYNGALNYVLSLSAVDMKWSVIGNMVGFLPGAVLFSVLGSNITSLKSILIDGNTNPKGLAMFCIVGGTTLACLGLLVLASKKLMQSARESATMAEIVATYGLADAKGDRLDLPHDPKAVPPHTLETV